MNTEWMRQRLEAYLALCDAYERFEVLVAFPSAHSGMVDLQRRAYRGLPTIEKIFAALDPYLLEGLVPLGDHGGHNVGDAVRQALGILADRDEWAVHLAPDAPALSADQLHPVVWAAAVAIWSTGEYKTAAGAAATAVAARIKQRSGSHLNDRELVAKVFSHDPPKPGQQAHLQLPGDRADKTWRSRQQGLHLLAQGAFAGIRNVAVHDERPWSEHEALEHLAVLSVVARWADETELVEPPSGP